MEDSEELSAMSTATVDDDDDSLYGADDTFSDDEVRKCSPVELQNTTSSSPQNIINFRLIFWLILFD